LTIARNNWARGYKTYRKGVLRGFVPPLDPLSVRKISPRFLSQDERIEIADLALAGVSTRGIAKRGQQPPRRDRIRCDSPRFFRQRMGCEVLGERSAKRKSTDV